MKIQLLNTSKLKITFTKIDLDENNISLHEFLAGNKSSLDFLKAIIEIANEDLGFSAKNNDFLYEIFCFDFSEFIIIVSANNDSDLFSYIPQKSSYYNMENISRDTNISRLSSFKFINNKLSNCENLIFFFNNFEDFLEFSNYIKSYINSFNITSFLYKYQNIFLLEITTSNLSPYELNKLLSASLEAETNSCISELTLIRFKEFAELLISDNALNL